MESLPGRVFQWSASCAEPPVESFPVESFPVESLLWRASRGEPPGETQPLDRRDGHETHGRGQRGDRRHERAWDGKRRGQAASNRLKLVHMHVVCVCVRERERDVCACGMCVAWWAFLLVVCSVVWLGACTLLGVEQAPIEGHTPMSVRAQRSDAQNRSSGACEYSYAVQRAGACVCLRALWYIKP